jgi:hypothetical protein
MNPITARKVNSCFVNPPDAFKANVASTSAIIDALNQNQAMFLPLSYFLTVSKYKKIK